MNPYRLLADGVVLFHLLFILFVVFGGFLALRWRRLAWLHLPCAGWGVVVELLGWVCPLTPLENSLRLKAGLHGYTGGFIEEYVIPVVYPPELTRSMQFMAAAVALGANVVAYGLVWRRSRRG